MASIPFDRLFSMPAFEGLRAIKKQQAIQEEIELDMLISIIKHLDPDYSSYDFEASIQLLEIIDIETTTSDSTYYRNCIKSLILHSQPTWVRMMRLGRKKFTDKLERDQRSIFREANLLTDPPETSIIEWWDEICGIVRYESDRTFMDQARKAEQLTIQYEEKILNNKGISEKPKWIAIDDNTAGYDVLSYDKNDYGLINKLIEVKSTIASPLRFYISRNEWNKACRSGDRYFFYIWDMKPVEPRLHIKTAKEIEPHIPKDNEKGIWDRAIIPIAI
ncbi:MAG: DUF3883 domain-containing protein [Gammaproteobacteria bacterium]|nr:DUF3883 domain-containing protein [Gammaproteobacteria bacterium]MDH5650700.1 DUF3883 domain-containing protein [Gammaproteobacteria bacterium]